MEVPLKIEDVTKDWLKNALEDAQDCKVQVLELAPLVTAGYLSTACKAKIQFENGEHQKLFMKFTLPKSDPFSAFLTEYNLDANEVNAYKNMFPKLVAFEIEKLGCSKLSEYLTRYFGGCKKDEGFYIILEDISDDFEMKNVAQGLSLEEIMEALKTLAYFHAISYCYGQENSTDFSESFPVNLEKFLEDDSLTECAVTGLELFVQDLENHAPDLVEKGKEFKSNFNPIFGNCLKQSDSRFLAHGDYWGNNVMFHKKNGGVKMVDWQWFSCMIPHLDFAFMAFSSNNPEVFEPHLDRIYRSYFDTLEETCLRFDLKVPFTFQDFVQDTKTKGLAPMLALFLYFYDPMGLEPNMAKRIRWLFRTILKENPDFLDVK